MITGMEPVHLVAGCRQATEPQSLIPVFVRVRGILLLAGLRIGLAI